MSDLSKSLEVASILVHRDLDDTARMAKILSCASKRSSNSRYLSQKG